MPTPIPFDTYITEGTQLVADFGVLPIIAAIAVAMLGTYIFRKVKSSVR